MSLAAQVNDENTLPLPVSIVSTDTPFYDIVSLPDRLNRGREFPIGLVVNRADFSILTAGALFWKMLLDHSAAPWLRGDFYNAVELKHGEKAAQIIPDENAPLTAGISAQTLINNASVAGRYPITRLPDGTIKTDRIAGLSFSMHSEVAYVEPLELRRYLLMLALESELDPDKVLTTQDMRDLKKHYESALEAGDLDLEALVKDKPTPPKFKRQTVKLDASDVLLTSAIDLNQLLLDMGVSSSDVLEVAVVVKHRTS